MNTASPQQRLTSLEIKLTECEHSIEQLNTALAAQYRDTQALWQRLHALEQRLAATTASHIPSARQPPPPYGS